MIRLCWLARATLAEFKPSACKRVPHMRRTSLLPMCCVRDELPTQSAPRALHVKHIVETLPVRRVRDELPMRRMPDAFHARHLSGKLPMRFVQDELPMRRVPMHEQPASCITNDNGSRNQHQLHVSLILSNRAPRKVP